MIFSLSALLIISGLTNLYLTFKFYFLKNHFETLNTNQLSTFQQLLALAKSEEKVLRKSLDKAELENIELKNRPNVSVDEIKKLKPEQLKSLFKDLPPTLKRKINRLKNSESQTKTKSEIDNDLDVF